MEKVADLNGTSDFGYMRKPDKRTKLEKLKLCLYDPADGSCLGRTPKNWGQLLLFYTLFYIVLAALFAICMQGLFSTLNDNEPKWKLDSSRIGTNPGLGFRPISDRTEEGSLIWFDAKNTTQVNKWVELLDEFTGPYRNQSLLPGGGKTQKDCNFIDSSSNGSSVCRMHLRPEDFKNCTSENKYGYANGAPCIFLKLNRIYNWVPEYYDDPDSADFPSKQMPPTLVEHIKSLPPAERKQVWVSCQGEYPVDKENIGPIQYAPHHGFPSFYYPFLNQKDYLSPLIAVQFQRPNTTILINIECRAWAKNIIYYGGNRDRQGSVHFEVMID